MTDRSVALAMMVAALLGLPTGASAQLATPKLGVESTGGARCPAPPRPMSPSPAARDRARELTTLGQQAAITGDNRAARDLFRQAADADPSDAGIAYYLARSLEALGDAPEALRQYCRALSLAPTGPDVADVRERLTRVAPRARALAEPAAARFRAGIEHYSQRRYREAAAAFDGVIGAAPEWEPAYYNRALSHVAMRNTARAVRDFEHYLELAPDAPDRVAVAREIARLRQQALSPSTALVAGLVPGAGQLYTRRPLLGLLVAGGVGGATYLAFREKDETRIEEFIDPFGNVREFEVTERVRPNYTMGLAAAAGVTLAGALEAYLYARRSRAALARPTTAPRQAARESTIGPVVSSELDGTIRVGVRLSFGGD